MTSPDDPHDTEALLQRGAELLGKGLSSAALEIFDAVLSNRPELVDAHVNRGVALRRMGRVGEALESYDRALALSPDHLAATYNRANALTALGRFEAALAGYGACLRANPDSPELHNSQGHALLCLGRAAEALAALDRALTLRPAFAGALHNRGVAMMALGQPAAALASFEAALAADAGLTAALGGRGAALVELGRDADAVDSLEAAIARDPAVADFHTNLAKAMLRLGQPERAVVEADLALAINPSDAAAHVNRGLALLSVGRFADGWPEYEWRWRTGRDLEAVTDPATRELAADFDPGVTTGDLKGRSVLLVGEQGIGDVLMFASVIPDLCAVAGEVSLLCEHRLQRLMAASFPQVRILTPASANRLRRTVDHVLPIGSLARLFRSGWADFPATPYLRASPSSDANWRARLMGAAPRLRVGISWQGGTPRTRRAARSMRLEDLRPVLELPDCEFVSLQYGDDGSEREQINATLDQPIRSFPSGLIEDFDDLAGLVRSLDVVVTVQTTLAHLAGGLGAPTLVMLPRVPEWRYAARGDTMPWYGSVRLLRQEAEGGWPQVVARVRERLAAQAAETD